MDKNNISEDSLFDGQLLLRQHRSGYRFSIDAVLLAHFVACQTGMAVLDLGTGCGVIPLILLYRHGSRLSRIVGIEVQAELAKRAQENLEINGFSKNGAMLCGDFREPSSLVAAESFDLVICNPPFYAAGDGRSSLLPEARVARHQLMAGLPEVCNAARYAVRNRGKVAIIYPAEKIGEAITTAKAYQLELKRLQFVYSYPQKDGTARLVLLEYSKNGGHGAEILSSFYVYQQKNGAFTEEMENFYQANGVFHQK